MEAGVVLVGRDVQVDVAQEALFVVLLLPEPDVYHSILLELLGGDELVYHRLGEVVLGLRVGASQRAYLVK